MMMKEKWADIPGYSNYQVSTLGRVWSKGNKLYLKPIAHSAGYNQCAFYKNRKQKIFLVHRLVLLAFVGPCPEGLETAHLDGDPLNNRLDNLIYTTPSENNLMKCKHGTMNNGERNNFARLTEGQVKEIRKTYRFRRRGFGTHALAKKYNTAQHTIWAIVVNKTWKHLLPE